jgi:hypothetical protein
MPGDMLRPVQTLPLHQLVEQILLGRLPKPLWPCRPPRRWAKRTPPSPATGSIGQLRRTILPACADPAWASVPTSAVTRSSLRISLFSRTCSVASKNSSQSGRLVPLAQLRAPTLVVFAVKTPTRRRSVRRLTRHGLTPSARLGGWSPSSKRSPNRSRLPTARPTSVRWFPRTATTPA